MTAARLTRGAMSLSSSSHFPLRPNSATVKPVAFPPGRDMRSTIPAPTGSGTNAKTMGTVVCCVLQCGRDLGANSQNDIGRERDQLCRVFASEIGVAQRQAGLDLQVAIFDPPQLIE